MKRRQLNSLLSPEFMFSVSLGLIPGYKLVTKFGAVIGVDNTTTDIWDGGIIYPFAETASTLDVVSEDAGDSYSLDTGGKEVTIIGLDSDFNSLVEVVQLDGLTPVTTTNEFYRVNRAAITKGSLIADVNIISTLTGDLQAKVHECNNQTLMCVFTVPAGFAAAVTFWDITVNEKKDATICAHARSNSSPDLPFQTKYVREIGDNPGVLPFTGPIVFDEKTDMRLRCTTTAVGVDVASAWQMILVDKSKVNVNALSLTWDTITI